MSANPNQKKVLFERELENAIIKFDFNGKTEKIKLIRDGEKLLLVASNNSGDVALRLEEFFQENDKQALKPANEQDEHVEIKLSSLQYQRIVDALKKDFGIETTTNINFNLDSPVDFKNLKFKATKTITVPTSMLTMTINDKSYYLIAYKPFYNKNKNNNDEISFIKYDVIEKETGERYIYEYSPKKPNVHTNVEHLADDMYKMTLSENENFFLKEISKNDKDFIKLHNVGLIKNFDGHNINAYTTRILDFKNIQLSNPKKNYVYKNTISLNKARDTEETLIFQNEGNQQQKVNYTSIVESSITKQALIFVPSKGIYLLNKTTKKATQIIDATKIKGPIDLEDERIIVLDSGDQISNMQIDDINKRLLDGQSNITLKANNKGISEATFVCKKFSCTPIDNDRWFIPDFCATCSKLSDKEYVITGHNGQVLCIIDRGPDENNFIMVPAHIANTLTKTDDATKERFYLASTLSDYQANGLIDDNDGEITLMNKYTLKLTHNNEYVSSKEIDKLNEALKAENQRLIYNDGAFKLKHTLKQIDENSITNNYVLLKNDKCFIVQGNEGDEFIRIAQPYDNVLYTAMKTGGGEYKIIGQQTVKGSQVVMFDDEYYPSFEGELQEITPKNFQSVNNVDPFISSLLKQVTYNFVNIGNILKEQPIDQKDQIIKVDNQRYSTLLYLKKDKTESLVVDHSGQVYYYNSTTETIDEVDELYYDFESQKLYSQKEKVEIEDGCQLIFNGDGTARLNILLSKNIMDSGDNRDTVAKSGFAFKNPTQADLDHYHVFTEIDEGFTNRLFLLKDMIAKMENKPSAVNNVNNNKEVEEDAPEEKDYWYIKQDSIKPPFYIHTIKYMKNGKLDEVSALFYNDKFVSLAYNIDEELQEKYIEIKENNFIEADKKGNIQPKWYSAYTLPHDATIGGKNIDDVFAKYKYNPNFTFSEKEIVKAPGKKYKQIKIEAIDTRELRNCLQRDNIKLEKLYDKNNKYVGEVPYDGSSFVSLKSKQVRDDIGNIKWYYDDDKMYIGYTNGLGEDRQLGEFSIDEYSDREYLTLDTHLIKRDKYQDFCQACKNKLNAERQRENNITNNLSQLDEDIWNGINDLSLELFDDNLKVKLQHCGTQQQIADAINQWIYNRVTDIASQFATQHEGDDFNYMNEFNSWLDNQNDGIHKNITNKRNILTQRYLQSLQEQQNQEHDNQNQQHQENQDLQNQQNQENQEGQNAQDMNNILNNINGGQNEDDQNEIDDNEHGQDGENQSGQNYINNTQRGGPNENIQSRGPQNSIRRGFGTGDTGIGSRRPNSDNRRKPFYQTPGYTPNMPKQTSISKTTASPAYYSSTSLSSNSGIYSNNRTGTQNSQQNAININTTGNNSNNNEGSQEEQNTNEQEAPTWTPTIVSGTLATLGAGATIAMKFVLDTKIGTIIGAVFTGAFGITAVITGIYTYNKKSEINNNESQTSLDENNQEAAPTVGN